MIDVESHYKKLLEQYVAVEASLQKSRPTSMIDSGWQTCPTESENYSSLADTIADLTLGPETHDSDKSLQTGTTSG